MQIELKKVLIYSGFIAPKRVLFGFEFFKKRGKDPFDKKGNDGGFYCRSIFYCNNYKTNFVCVLTTFAGYGY